MHVFDSGAIFVAKFILMSSLCRKRCSSYLWAQGWLLVPIMEKVSFCSLSYYNH